MSWHSSKLKARKKRNLIGSNMRIGIFSESYEPIQNGVAVSVRTLIDELRARHHHVVALVPHYPNYEDASPFVLRVPSVLTAMNADYPVPIPWFPRVKRDIRKLHLDVLHSQSPFFMGILALRISRRYGIPHISTYHTLYEQYVHYVMFMPGVVTVRMIDWWLPRFYNDCDCAVVPSHVAERNLRRLGVECRIEVIPTGIPIPPAESVDSAAQQAARERWQIPQNAALLLYVGRLGREKNVELVMDSFQDIAAEFPDAVLLIAGGGPHAAALQERAQAMQSADRIRFSGPIPRHDLDPLYATATALLFASATETQGLVVGEARAAGTPVIVVNGGGAPETVTHGEDGFIVNATLADFSDAVRTLLKYDKEPMREACLRNARRFTPDAMADRILGVYESVLQDPGRESVPVAIAAE